ncbi:hypothetical protein BDN72DRAFT_847493 [Pluteus cervinus]|uniref:Uncharacterized protein n=1 Tax=Pluteus cervinus TaxID=181527 RepID=A0ACD3AD32_9AGAR|nr:hypothetical protein BDN72DRAFT_847493 [Pluteus cervinus]
MSLIKLPLIAIDAFNMLLNATPPNPPQPLSEHLIPDWRERFLRSLALPSRVIRSLYWSAGLIEVLIILASHIPTSPVAHPILSVLFFNGSSPQKICVSWAFILGFTLTLIGTYIRLNSFRTLGRLFTFELCIRKDHRLIVDGPYALVRHPSYTGLILNIIGACVNHVSGSWARESGALDTTLGRTIALLWMLGAGAVVLSLVLRVPKEDEILRKRFGNEWVEWAERVPYKFVPGVY